MKHDDNDDNRRVGAAATARSLVVGWCCVRFMFVSFSLHHSVALATATGASRSCSFVLCLLLAFGRTRRETSVYYVMCTNAYLRIVDEIGFFCVDRVRARACLFGVNESACKNNTIKKEKEKKKKKKENEKSHLHVRILWNYIFDHLLVDIHVHIYLLL